MANEKWHDVMADHQGRSSDELVAAYTSEPFTVAQGDDVVDTTCTIDLHVCGSDEDGWLIYSRDEAGGPNDEAGNAIYDTRETAVAAAVAFAEERGGSRN